MSTDNDQDKTPPTIRHIVMSGGGVCGFSFYGALRESHRMGAWDIRNIETIYGCSVGSIFGVVLSLKSFFTWDELDAYFIQRPWHQVFTFDLPTMIQSIQSCGLFNVKCVEQVMAPLFSAIDISLNITMREMYEKTGIELHLFVTRLNAHFPLGHFELIDISHVTHPDWRVIDAAYCSSALPVVFVPHIVDHYYYIDGGFLCNYPVNQCIERSGNPDEIFGLSNSIANNVHDTTLKPATAPNLAKSLFDFILLLLNSMWYMITLKPSQVKCQYDSNIDILHMGDMYRTATSSEYRAELANMGSTKIRELDGIKPFLHSCTANRNDDTLPARDGLHKFF